MLLSSLAFLQANFKNPVSVIARKKKTLFTVTVAKTVQKMLLFVESLSSCNLVCAYSN